MDIFWKNSVGLNLYSKLWAVPSPKAIVALIHGQGEHIQRYEHLATYYNNNGVAVWGYDQQGFGKSEGPRGHAPNLDAYLNDVGSFIEQVNSQFPGLPIFLYGHSMGGNVVLNYSLRKKDTRLTGIIATGPWIRLAFEAPAIKVLAGRLMRSILPKLALSSGLDTRLLSKDPAVVNAYNKDPLVHDKVSAAAGISLIEGAAWINAYSESTPCPMLLMHGDSDGITSCPATQALSERLTGPATWKAWSGMYHEIHNEPDQKAVFDYTLHWIERILT